MRARLVVGLVVMGVAARAAAADDGVRATARELSALREPVSRLELRCDVGVLATRAPGDGRAGFDVEIAMRPDYWYGVGVATIRSTTTTTTTVSAGELMTTRVTEDGLGISARLFKRLGPLVLSAGVFDNAGSVGVELRALDDHVRLEALGTNWRPSNPVARPHLRVGGSAQWGLVYVQAGALDVAQGALATAYAGVGLRWRDPDLLATLWWLRR